MNEGELAPASPRTPEMKDQRIPPRATHRLREILILLVPRKTMQEYPRRMPPRSLRLVKHRIQPRTLNLKNGIDDQRRMKRIEAQWIHRHRRIEIRSLCRPAVLTPQSEEGQEGEEGRGKSDRHREESWAEGQEEAGLGVD